MLALKSGLLAQSTWALDVLNIQLHDDHSVHWFGLQTMPGLLDILTDYWNCVTSAMFPDKFEVTKPEVRDVKVAVAKEEEESLDSFKPQLNTKLEKVGLSGLSQFHTVQFRRFLTDPITPSIHEREIRCAMLKTWMKVASLWMIRSGTSK